MAAPGPHRVDGVHRRNSLVESFRRLRAEWTRYRDGGVMSNVMQDQIEGKGLVHRGQSMDDERRGRVDTVLRRRNSFSNAIKKLRKEWSGRRPNEEETPPSKEVVEEVEMKSYRVLKAHERRHSTGSQKQKRQSVCATPNCPCGVAKEFTKRLMLADQQVDGPIDADQASSPQSSGQLDKHNSMNGGPEDNIKSQDNANPDKTAHTTDIRWDRPKLADVKRELAKAESRQNSSHQGNDNKQDVTLSTAPQLDVQRASIGDRITVLKTDNIRENSQNTESLRVLETAEPLKHRKGCTDPKCACNVVREYTQKVLAEDAARKGKRSPEIPMLRGSPRNSLESPPPKAELRTQRKSSGCSSSDCPCTATKIYTENLLNADRLKRANSTRETTQSQPETSRQRRASEPSRRVQKPPPLDRDTLRQLAKEYSLKKQAHNTKRVVTRDAEKGWSLSKYKTLVEISDSIPDLLQMALEDKERRREERKEIKFTRNRSIRRAVQDAALSSSDYAMRRRSAVPHYHSYPKRDAPAMPALMAKLPKPPNYYRENSV